LIGRETEPEEVSDPESIPSSSPTLARHRSARSVASLGGFSASL